jgi:hypothetical protein
MYPLIVEPPVYNAADQPSNGVVTLYETYYKNVLVQFGDDNTASFFLTYTQGGRRFVFRDEYTQLKFFPFKDRGRVDRAELLQQILMTPFHNITRVSDRLLVMNATMYTATNPKAFAVQWIWEFDVVRPDIQAGQLAIKFSIRMTSPLAVSVVVHLNSALTLQLQILTIPLSAHWTSEFRVFTESNIPPLADPLSGVRSQHATAARYQ